MGIFRLIQPRFLYPYIMKRTSVSLILAVGALFLGASALRADSPAPRTLAQALVDQAIGENPNMMVLGMHAIAPGTKDSAIIASNIGRIGKKDDDDDLDAFRKNSPVFEPVKEKHRYEVLIPMRQKDGKPIGVMGMVFHWNGEDEGLFLATATRIRDGMQAKIPSLDALFNAADDSFALLTPTSEVKIPDSKGKFDFLEVDSVNNRLLASHEKDGTSDYIDLGTRQLITRLKIGTAVHAVLDPALGKYFVSCCDDQTVVIVDAASLKQTGAIKMGGDLDAIILDPKNHRLYSANDEGTHIWEIDPVTEKVTGDIAIPGAPEYMVYDAATDRIYLNLKPASEMVVIDPAALKVVAHWTTPFSPHGLALDPVTGRLFSAGLKGQLGVIDTKTGNTIATVQIPEMVDQIAFDPATRRVYCACANVMGVVQETDTGAVLLGTVKTAATAKNVAVDPKTHEVWTTFTDGKDSYAKSWRP